MLVTFDVYWGNPMGLMIFLGAVGNNLSLSLLVTLVVMVDRSLKAVDWLKRNYTNPTSSRRCEPYCPVRHWVEEGTISPNQMKFKSDCEQAFGRQERPNSKHSKHEQPRHVQPYPKRRTADFYVQAATAYHTTTYDKVQGYHYDYNGPTLPLKNRCSISWKSLS